MQHLLVVTLDIFTVAGDLLLAILSVRASYFYSVMDLIQDLIFQFYRFSKRV